MTFHEFYSKVSSWVLPSGIHAVRAMNTGERVIQYQEMARERSRQEFLCREYSFASGKKTYAEATVEEREQWKSNQRNKADGFYQVIQFAEHADIELSQN